MRSLRTVLVLAASAALAAARATPLAALALATSAALAAAGNATAVPIAVVWSAIAPLPTARSDHVRRAWPAAARRGPPRACD